MFGRALRLVPGALGLLAFAVPSGAATRGPSPQALRPFVALHPSLARPDTSATVIYSFAGGHTPGTYGPVASLIADASGGLYGTTLNGGSQTGVCAALSGCGGVFKLTHNPSGGYTESLLYTLQGGADGAGPYADLFLDSSGALYGTTAYGGSGTCVYGGQNFGCGTVFKLTPGGSGVYTESVIYSFQGGSDGAVPIAGVVGDAHGGLFGTTQAGGDASGDGTIFKLVPTASGYKKRTLHQFHGCSTPSLPCDGSSPAGDLYADASGTFFGTTLYGGAHKCLDNNLCGTVYRLIPNVSNPRAYHENIVYNFTGGSDGESPVGALIADSHGALYGATGLGGGASASACNLGSIVRGCGTVFKLTPGVAHPKHYKESVLYAFKSNPDGALPQAGVIADASGALYGTTQLGGKTPTGIGGCGAVFKLTPTASGYTESLLYGFKGCNASSIDASFPRAGLIGLSGVLYGTTWQGGRFGSGTVFQF
jgi:uncharacterized repeat protein (TIGR03803 family)